MQQQQELQDGMEEPYPFQTKAPFNRFSLQPGAAYKLVYMIITTVSKLFPHNFIYPARDLWNPPHSVSLLTYMISSSLIQLISLCPGQPTIRDAFLTPSCLHSLYVAQVQFLHVHNMWICAVVTSQEPACRVYALEWIILEKKNHICAFWLKIKRFISKSNIKGTYMVWGFFRLLFFFSWQDEWMDDFF